MAPTATSSLSRRQCCVGLAALLGGLAAQGCSTVSPQEERQIGGKEAQEVLRASGGVKVAVATRAARPSRGSGASPTIPR